MPLGLSLSPSAPAFKPGAPVEFAPHELDKEYPICTRMIIREGTPVAWDTDPLSVRSCGHPPRANQSEHALHMLPHGERR